jgi:hypothetical protein
MKNKIKKITKSFIINIELLNEVNVFIKENPIVSNFTQFMNFAVRNTLKTKVINMNQSGKNKEEF